MFQTKFSNLDLDICKKYLNIEEDFKEDDNLIIACLVASKDYICSYTNLNPKVLDTMPSTNIACLLLMSEMYSNRTVLGGYETSKINVVLKSILDLNRVWL